MSHLTSGFNAMGKPVPQQRRQNAYDLLKQWGISTEEAWSTVESMSRHLERDKPHEAQERAMLTVDLTGSYRLIAVLLTGGETVSVPEEAVA